MKQISIEFDLPLPNNFLVNHSFSEGKTRKYTYHGPDKIYLQIGEDGTEKYGPITEDEIADGRPVPADVVEWFEVDCATDPLICQLRGPVVNELQEEPTGEVVHPGSPVIEGYPQYTYQTPLMPADVYNKFFVKVINGKAVPTPFTTNQKLHDKDQPLTWNDIRKHRDQLLSNSDGQIAEDMPQSLKDDWVEYRQKLRDLPTVMENAGVSPDIAYHMFPDQPNINTPPPSDI